jgi:hypothetical protein
MAGGTLPHRAQAAPALPVKMTLLWSSPGPSSTTWKRTRRIFGKRSCSRRGASERAGSAGEVSRLMVEFLHSIDDAKNAPQNRPVASCSRRRAKSQRREPLPRCWTSRPFGFKCGKIDTPGAAGSKGSTGRALYAMG